MGKQRIGRGRVATCGEWRRELTRRLNSGSGWVGLTTPPRALFFQTLDINWTGMTNLLDIPGLRYPGLTEHLLSAAAWPGGLQSRKRCSGALQQPGAELGR